MPVARDDDKKADAAADPGEVGWRRCSTARPISPPIIDRVREQNPDLILYVVDQRQHGHFEQVFRAARQSRHLTGKAHARTCRLRHHERADGKPFKTRAGGVMKLYDLIAMATAEAEKRLAEAGHRRRLSGRGARRDRAQGRHRRASNSPISPITAPRTISSTWSGSPDSKARPGPICNMRPCASNRCCARRREQGVEIGRPAIRSPEERKLVLQLLPLGDAMAAAEDKRAPNMLCEYAFTLAQEFSRFYAAHHVLSETDAGLAGRPAGALRPGFGGFDPGPGPFGHRSPAKECE